jgi:hypothetical protein
MLQLQVVTHLQQQRLVRHQFNVQQQQYQQVKDVLT